MPKFVWQAQCGVCEAGFELDTETNEKPHPHGVFCPDCMKRGIMLKGVLNFQKAPNLELRRFLLDLKESDAPVLLAALWAGMDVHAPLDQLTGEEHDRLEYLANKLNEVLTLARDSDTIST